MKEGQEKCTDARVWFGFSKMPFQQDLKEEDMFLRPCMEEIRDRVAFSVQNGMYFAAVGDVGAGKSTSMRYALSRLPKKQYHVVHMTGGSWSFVELLRGCMFSLGSSTRTSQQSTMLRLLGEAYASLRESSVTPVLFIDEAQLFQRDVFRQLHLLSQPSGRGKTVPIVLCGQESLVDSLSDPLCKPLMSRIMDGYSVHAMGVDEYQHYMDHQIRNIGGAGDIFDDAAITVIHQTTSGLPRRVNEISLLALKRAMSLGANRVSADMVRHVTKDWWNR